MTTYGNVPKSCKCSICLDDFEETSKISHLNCYHYFHSACLATHFEYMTREIEKEKQEAKNNKIVWKVRRVGCPVCREPMTDEQEESMQKFKSQNTIRFEDISKENVCISKKMRQLQKQMNCLYEKQKKLGGIIDRTEPEVIILNVKL